MPSEGYVMGSRREQVVSLVNEILAKAEPQKLMELTAWDVLSLGVMYGTENPSLDGLQFIERMHSRLLPHGR